MNCSVIWLLRGRVPGVLSVAANGTDAVYTTKEINSDQFELLTPCGLCADFSFLLTHTTSTE